MNFLGNVVWFFLGGIVQSFIWFLFGCLWSVTIIGIPVGRQCFKLAKMQLTLVEFTKPAPIFLLNILAVLGIELNIAKTAGDFLRHDHRHPLRSAVLKLAVRAFYRREGKQDQSYTQNINR